MSAGQGLKINTQERAVNLIELSRRYTETRPQEQTSEVSFREMFSKKLAASHKLNFSRHAQGRMFSRGIELSEESLNRIAEAIDKAQSKGSRETLVLIDEAAFVVSVVNRTVITAFDHDNLRQGVVTSIDSAVIA